MNIKAGSGSSIEIVIPFFPSGKTFTNSVKFNLQNVTASSSVTFEPFIVCEKFQSNIEIISPLKWSGKKTNIYTINIKYLELFLLYQHIIFLQDMIHDFSAGINSSVESFIPADYVLNLEITDINLFLNLNENNIIELHNNLDVNSINCFD